MNLSVITTPFGPIRVYADDKNQDYMPEEYVFDRPPVKGHPVAGCSRVRVPVGEYRSIRCEVEWNDISVRNTGSSGECYADAEFISGSKILTIGAEDENPAFDTVRTERGMEYRIHDPVAEVVFGIAWATDYAGPSDCRTWYAADPTLDRA